MTRGPNALLVVLANPPNAAHVSELGSLFGRISTTGMILLARQFVRMMPRGSMPFRVERDSLI